MGCIVTKLKVRKLAKVGVLTSPMTLTKGQTDQTTPQTLSLSDVHKAVIRNNWRTLQRHVANVGVLTFVGMFESKPEILQIFSMFKGKDLTELHHSGLLRNHALRVMTTIDKCISRLDEPSKMADILWQVGEHHTKYNVPIDYLEIILPNFLNAIKPRIEDVWCQELEDAWSKLFELMLRHIKEGMTSQRTAD